MTGNPFFFLRKKRLDFFMVLFIFSSFLSFLSMSVYEGKVSNRKGNNSKKGQAHQNSTAWKANKNSKKSREIAALPVYGLCQRCTDVILWRKKYKKYKPLTTVKRW